jgi:hypothetical protein
MRWVQSYPRASCTDRAADTVNCMEQRYQWASCTNRAGDTVEAEGAALPPVQAVLTGPPTPVMRKMKRYPPDVM